MPKDATKNVDRYKIRGGHLNEFEYTQNQKAVAEKKPQGGGKLIPGTPPEEAGDGALKARTSNATKGTKSTKPGKATKSTKASKATKSTKGTKKKANSSTKGATPKKLAARKAAAKK